MVVTTEIVTGRMLGRLARVSLATAATVLLLAGPAIAATMSFSASFSSGSLGDGTTMTGVFTIGGTEFAGGPEPLSNVSVHLPAGVGGSRSGFASCEESTLRLTGPTGCAPGSLGGPPGNATMQITFGTERVAERGTVQTYFGPGEAVYFYVVGTSPVSIEVILTATYTTDTAPYGRLLNVTVPPIETVPGAPHASFTSLTLGFGASRIERSSEVQRLTIPAECPSPGFGWLASTGFDNGATAQANYVSPCPSGRPTSPLLGEREAVRVAAGEVTVRAKGSTSFQPLTSAGTIPDGSEVDTTNGRAVIAVATKISGQTESAEIYGGRLLAHQDPRLAETTLALSLPLTGCPRAVARGASRAAQATVSRHRPRPRSRHLWVSESGGNWSTSGRYVSTSVEGTKWLTQDECGRSLVRVASGKVKVRDLIRKRTRIVSGGQTDVVRRQRAKRR